MATGQDADGTFDIPKFEGTVFEGSGKSGSSGKGEDGLFVN